MVGKGCVQMLFLKGGGKGVDSGLVLRGKAYVGVNVLTFCCPHGCQQEGAEENE